MSLLYYLANELYRAGKVILNTEIQPMRREDEDGELEIVREEPVEEDTGHPYWPFEVDEYDLGNPVG